METRDNNTPPVRRRSVVRQPRRRQTLQLPRPTLTRPWIIGTAGTLALGIGLAIAIASSNSTITVHGSLTLGPGTYVPDGYGSCTPGDGYNDISAGTAVTIGDQTGATIAVGQLQPGRADGDGQQGCVFNFDIQAPGGRKLYTVTVSHRGTQVFQPDQIQNADLVLNYAG